MGRTRRFVEAALAGDRATVGRCLSPSWFGMRKPIPVDERDESLGITALMAAAKRGQVAVAALLLEHGADVNALSLAGPSGAESTALHLAASEHQPEMVAWLLEKGAEPDPEERRGTDALAPGAQSGDRKTMALLLERGADAFSGTQEGKGSTIRWILQKGDEDLLRHFIAHAPNLKGRDRKGRTALSMAIHEGKPGLVALLLNAEEAASTPVDALLHRAAELARDASPDRVRVFDLLLDRFPPRDAQSAGLLLRLAISLGRTELARAMFDLGASDDGEPPLLSAASAAGSLECVRLLLDHGSDPNAAGADGVGVLGMALSKERLEIAALLLDRGADPRKTPLPEDKQGEPALVRAAQEGKLDLVSLLVRCGADLEAREASFGWTPLMIAADRGRTEVARFFVSAGANVNASANRGLTPLHAAAQSGDVEVMKLLLDHGALIEARNDGGGTPLMDAAYHGKPEAVRVLAARGAALDAQTTSGMTALMWAAERSQLDVVELLVKLGCALDLQDLQHGKTALMGAAAVGDLGIVRALLDAGASTDIRDHQGDKVHAWVGSGNHGAIVDELRKVRDKSAGASHVHSGVVEKVVVGSLIGLMALGTAVAAAQQPKAHARPRAAVAKTRVTDSDGNVYRTVAIGKQTWMAENLRTTRYRDGSSVRHLEDDKAWGSDTEGAYCAYEGDAARAAAYGLLYNGYAILNPKGLCPAGWHVPNDQEWLALIDHLGGERGAGGKLKEKGDAHWLENVGATDSTGFSALPGGHRFTNFLSNESRFDWLGLRGFYASSTEWGDKSVWCRDLQNLNPDVGRIRWTGRSGVTVRCIRD